MLRHDVILHGDHVTERVLSLLLLFIKPRCEGRHRDAFRINSSMAAWLLFEHDRRRLNRTMAGRDCN